MSDFENESNQTTGYVYIFTNPSFKNDWVKIGYTDDVDRRLRELSNTSVPLPFEKYAVLQTRKYIKVEKHIHNMLDCISPDRRISPNREFFNIAPDDALYILWSIASILDDCIVTTYKNDNNSNNDVVIVSTTKSSDVQDNIDTVDFSNITKELIERAAKFIDTNGIPDRYKSRTWQVILNDKKYPPKYLMALAYMYHKNISVGDVSVVIPKLLSLFITYQTFPVYKRLGIVCERIDCEEIEE